MDGVSICAQCAIGEGRLTPNQYAGVLLICMAAALFIGLYWGRRGHDLKAENQLLMKENKALRDELWTRFNSLGRVVSKT